MDQAHTSAGAKRPVLIGAGVATICAAVYFSYYAPPQGVEGVSGTIATAGRERPGKIAGGDGDLRTSGGGMVMGMDAADEKAITRLKKAATALGKTARDLSTRPGFDATVAGDLRRAAAELGVTAQALLEGRGSIEQSTAATLERQAVELNSAANLARGILLEAGAAADFQKNAAALESAAIAARSSLDRERAPK